MRVNCGIVLNQRFIAFQEGYQIPHSNNSTIITGIWHDINVAALGTLEEDGAPHVSFVTIVPQKDGTAVLLLSDLARHTANIKRDARVTLLVMANHAHGGGSNTGFGEDPLAEVRITVHGAIELYPVDKLEDGKARYVKHHPASVQYINFQDFNLYLFKPSKIFLVGGFGRIETFSADILI